MAQDQARIWYQSFVSPVEQAPYMERLQSLLDGVASPSVRFEVHGLDLPDHSLHPLTSSGARRRSSVMRFRRRGPGTTPS